MDGSLWLWGGVFKNTTGHERICDQRPECRGGCCLWCCSSREKTINLTSVPHQTSQYHMASTTGLVIIPGITQSRPLRMGQPPPLIPDAPLTPLSSDDPHPPNPVETKVLLLQKKKKKKRPKHKKMTMYKKHAFAQCRVVQFH